MTPWNMVGMAKIKGLDVIAITDHNAVLNAEDAMAAGREYGVEVIPGMEITTREEVHMLAYFYRLEDALRAGEEIYAHLADVRNEPALFGNQIIKNIVCRPRPCHIANVPLLIDMPRGFSFPSGHTFSSFVAATVIAKCDRRFGYAALTFASLIAFSRMYLYVHFPTDVLAGVACGIFFAFLTVYVGNIIAKKIEQELEYPGQIRVNVIRETRSTEFAK